MQRVWQRRVEKLLDAAFERNRQSIDDVAEATAQAILTGRRVYAFGAGHSLSLVNEMYRRAGSLKNVVRPIWNDDLLSKHDEDATGRLETTRGYYHALTDGLDWGPGDLCWVISNSGRNALVVELAMDAKRHGVTVVGLTSIEHSSSVAATPGLPKLTDIADHVLDNAGCLGDAAVEIPGLDERVGPTSTITGAVLIHAVWAEAVARLVERGHVPEIWGSANRGPVGPVGPAGDGQAGTESGQPAAPDVAPRAGSPGMA